jgi:hypothetical protein
MSSYQIDGGIIDVEKRKKQAEYTLGDPTVFPPEFLVWMKRYIEQSGITLPASAIFGISSDAARAASYGTSLPAVPADGDEHILVDSLTLPNYAWRFRYNAGSFSIYKWDFIGGGAAWATAGLGVGETIGALSTWQDLTTVGPRVLGLRAGIYDAIGVTQAQGPVALNQIDFWDQTVVGYLAEAWSSKGATVYDLVSAQARVEIATSGHDLRMRYWSNTAGTQFYNRSLRVIPVRIS